MRLVGRKLYEILAKRMNLEVAFLGDFHIGNPATDEELIKKELEQVAKEDAQIVLMGDLVENITRSSIGNIYSQTYTPEEQIERVVNLLMPYKDRILGIIEGNHSSRSKKDAGLSPEKIIADMLGVPYFGYDAPLEIKVGSARYYVYAAHGSGGASTKEGKMRAVQKWAKIYPDMNAYVSGHHHDRMIWGERVYRTHPGKLEEETRYYVITGAYMEQPEYAKIKALPLGTRGGVIMEFYNSGEMSVRPISD